MLLQKLNSLLRAQSLPVLLIDKRHVSRERVESALELLEMNVSGAQLPDRTTFEIKRLLTIIKEELK
jgi:tRNA isopentenyl-2-thiomethyl-A-37 hydroxylase MiaE